MKFKRIWVAILTVVLLFNTSGLVQAEESTSSSSDTTKSDTSEDTNIINLADESEEDFPLFGSEPPKLEGVKDLSIVKGEKINLLADAIATDEKDKDIISRITVSSIDVNKVGVQEVTYKVVDSLGNTTTQKAKVTVNELKTTKCKLVRYHNKRGEFLAIRKSYSNCSEYIGTLYYGEKVTVIAKLQNSNWVKVKMEDGTVGYCSKSYLSTKKPKNTEANDITNPLYIKINKLMNKKINQLETYGFTVTSVDAQANNFYTAYSISYNTPERIPGLYRANLSDNKLSVSSDIVHWATSANDNAEDMKNITIKEYLDGKSKGYAIGCSYYIVIFEGGADSGTKTKWHFGYWIK